MEVVVTMPTSNIGIVLEAERFLIEIFMVIMAMTGAVIVTSLILDKHGVNVNPSLWWQKRQKTATATSVEDMTS